MKVKVKLGELEIATINNKIFPTGTFLEFIGKKDNEIKYPFDDIYIGKDKDNSIYAVLDISKEKFRKEGICVVNSWETKGEVIDMTSSESEQMEEQFGTIPMEMEEPFGIPLEEETKEKFRKDYIKKINELALKGIEDKKGDERKIKKGFKITRNVKNLFIANRIYIELVTRKAALPFDEDNDVIVEVYNSWYALFSAIREEIKNIPRKYLQTHNPTEELVGLTVSILNDVLRDHLTKYQAKFRRWYNIESEKTGNQTVSPQDLQKRYTDYDNLITDLKEVNSVLINYSDELIKLIKG